METRINIQQLEPKAFQAMFGLEIYLRNSSLNPTHKELLKLRASQINGCAYCVDMHTTDALKMGETPRRLFAVSAWIESPLFSEEERVVLQMTEELTLIHRHGLSKETYDRAISTFGDHYTAQLIMAIATINAWNRIAVSTHLVFEPHA
jgi:AhpD family alkylhydroperoxidase